jgi:PAS domain S-box-containing protein
LYDRKRNETVRQLQDRLQLATTCLEQIAEGNFNLSLTHNMDGDAIAFNDVLSRASQTLNRYQVNDKQRMWATEGLSRFMSLLQGDATSQKDFFDRILSFVVQYLQASQGGLFLLNDRDPSDCYLELTACYAYSKKRYVEKRIDVGQGLLGQVFLEKQTAVLKSVPADYVQITSGLGEATPRFLLLIPLRYNDDVLGVLEIASFEEVETYQIQFVEQIMESLASVCTNMRNKQKVDQLLHDAEIKASALKEKEETLKRKLEELRAMQDEMIRNQAELARQSNLMKFIIDNIPFPIFVKDENGRYSLVNRAESRLFNLTDKELLGKDDRHFVADDEEWNMIQQSDQKVLSSDTPVELPIQSFTTSTGARYIFKTTKIPFVNDVTGKKNILGVSIDLTEKLRLEKKLYREQLISSRHAFINVVGRQRMLSQKIGFYCHLLASGKTQHAPLLEEAIALHGHTLHVIEFGGIPQGLVTTGAIPAADETLKSYIWPIKEIWRGYQDAANRILVLGSENKTSSAFATCLSFIEENCERLLQANDNLMQACLSIDAEAKSNIFDEAEVARNV